MLFYFEKYVKQFLQRIIKTKKESIYVRYVLSSIVSCPLMLLRVIASNLQTLTRDEKRKSVGPSPEFSRHRGIPRALFTRVRSVHYTVHNDQNIQCRKIGHLISPDAPVRTSSPEVKAENSLRGGAMVLMRLMRLGAQ